MINKNKIKIAVVGLGYVGLPLAVEFSKKFLVIGFDINKERVDQLKQGKDYTNEVSSDQLKSTSNLIFSSNVNDLIKALSSSIVSSVIYTDITKDGSLKGVSLDQTVNFAKSIPHSVIASGGVSSLNDISRLAKEVSNGVRGVIVGRAFYDKKFTFSEALQKIKEAKV